MYPEDGDWYLYNPDYTEDGKKNLLTLEYFQEILKNDCDIVDDTTGEVVFERNYPEGTTAEQLYDEYLKEQGVDFENNEGEEEETFRKGLNPSNSKFTMYTRNRLYDGYTLKSGKYIVERYLLDDIFETDAVELQFNQPNFQVAKLLPVSYERATTMGTAGLWKMIMLAFSYEWNLAIPEAENVKLEIGGLSRLMRVGYNSAAENDDKDKTQNTSKIGVAKLDFNSLYPSVCVSMDYKPDVDLMNIMITMLRYMLSTREKYKAEKKKWGKEADRLKEILENTSDSNEIEKIKLQIYQAKRNKGRYDKMQLSFKVLCNSFFGACSSNVFYWNSQEVGSRITGCGRQMFRLLIVHVTKTISQNPDYQYVPLVGDSVTGDTPLFVKNDADGLISIRPIASLFENENVHRDVLGREYFIPKGGYKVLCRSGWMKPNYLYRHETTKPIYRIEDGDVIIECTEDHSIFDSNRRKIKPSEINDNTELEYYKGKISLKNNFQINSEKVVELAKATARETSEYGVIPEEILNTTKKNKKLFVEIFNKEMKKQMTSYSKSIQAGLNFLK